MWGCKMIRTGRSWIRSAEDDVQEDDVEMTVEGGASSAGDPADEDPFEKQMCLSYESQVRRTKIPDPPIHFSGPTNFWPEN
jgi:hypothetical protein